MTSLRLLSPDHSLAPDIIEHLSAHQAGNDFSSWVIALPTHRLGGLVSAGLASRRTAIIPPEVITFEKLLSRFAEELGFAESRNKLSENQVRLLLTASIQATPQTSIAPTHLQELRILMREIEELDIRSQAFDRLRVYLSSQVHRTDGQMNAIMRRANDIEAVLTQFYQMVEQRGSITPEVYHRLELNFLSEKLSTASPPEHKNYLIAGLTSLMPSEVSIFAKLCRYLNAEVWLYEAPAQCLHPSPVNELIRALRPSYQRPPEQITDSQNFISITDLPDTIMEVHAALNICSNRTKPTHAEAFTHDGSDAILIPDEPTYRKTLNEVLARSNIPCNLAIPAIFGETPIGVWLNSFFQAWRQPITDSSLDPGLSFFTHPVTIQLLAGHSPESRLSFQHQICSWFGELRNSGRQWKSALRTLKPDWLAAASDQAWIKVFDASFEQRDFEFWQIVLTILTQLKESAPSSEDVESITTQLKGQLAFISLSPDLRERSLSDELLEQLLKTEFRQIGEPLTGLQVLNLSEARLYPFRSVVVLGCRESVIPRSRPRDELLDDGMKKKMGLAGWQVFEALTEQNFFWLVEQVPQIYLLAPRAIAGTDAIRSRYLEQLLAYGRAFKWTYSTPIENSSVAAATDRLFEIGQRLPVMDLWSTRFSATAIKSLVSCPYRFLLGRLGIRPIDLSPREDDLRIEGEVLHEILRSFFSDHQAPPHLAWPKNQTSHQHFYQVLLNRLCWFTDQSLTQDDQTAALRNHLKFYSWPRFCVFLSHQLEIFRYDHQQIWSEIDIESFLGHTPSLRIGSHDYPLRGRIDLIVGDGKNFIVIDFKRSSFPANTEIKSGQEPQIALYAMALLDKTPDSVPGSVGGFFSILDGEWGGRLRSKELPLDFGPLISRSTPSLDEAIAGLGQILDWRRSEAMQTSVGFSPDTSACELCEFFGICRKDDPGMSEELRPRMRLSERFGL
jgi:hypothetical protein